MVKRPEARPVIPVAPRESLSGSARKALARTDWTKLDAMTDGDIARQIASNPDAAPDMAPSIDVRAIRRATGMTQAQFATAFEFSVRTVQEWERGVKRPSGPALTLLRALEADPEGFRRALAAAPMASLDASIERGVRDMASGRVRNASDVLDRLEAKFAASVTGKR
jgi:putative transcriptional regulator